MTGAGELHAVKCDVTKEEDVKAAFEWVKSRFASIHILVNNAGMMSSGFLIGKWRTVIDDLLIKYLNIIFISRRTRGCGRRGCGGRNGEITMYIGCECNGRLFGHPRGHTNHDGQQPRGTCSANQQVGHIILMLKGKY